MLKAQSPFLCIIPVVGRVTTLESISFVLSLDIYEVNHGLTVFRFSYLGRIPSRSKTLHINQDGPTHFLSIFGLACLSWPFRAARPGRSLIPSQARMCWWEAHQRTLREIVELARSGHRWGQTLLPALRHSTFRFCLFLALKGEEGRGHGHSLSSFPPSFCFLPLGVTFLNSIIS